MQKLHCPRGGVSHLRFSPDGEVLAGLGTVGRGLAWANKHAVYCWFRSRDWEPTGLEHHGPITGLAFHPGGRTLAYAGIASSWSVPPAPPPPPPPGAPVPSVWRRRFARETPRPFTGVHLYPLTGTDEFVPSRLFVPQAEGEVVRPDTWARGLAFTPDGRALVAGHLESTAFGLGPARANVLHWHFTETDGVWQAADRSAATGATERGGALVDGYLALAGAWGAVVCPVEPASGLYVPDVQAATVVAVSPARELVAVWESGAICVWHLRAAEPVAKARSPAGAVTALAFAPDGLTLAVGHSGGTVTAWHPLTGEVVSERDYGVGPVAGLAYAPDGLTLAVAGRTGLVVVDTD